MLESINPATNERVATYETMSASEVEEALQAASAAAEAWARRPVGERAEKAGRAAEVLEARKDALATRITNEMGKPIAQARAEIEKCEWVCRYYAGHGADLLADRPIEVDAPNRAFVAHEPLGVVLAVMPWNFPFWQVLRFAAPALTAGNGAVLKHSANVTGCALDLERVFEEAGYPKDLFRTLRIRSSQVDAVLENPRVQAATLTGSEAAGRAVAAKAGERIKKTVLELGGSDPYLILDDADVEAAAEKCAQSRLINTGQSCIAAKRFITVPASHEAFLETFVAAMARRQLSDPLDPDAQLGPMAREDLRDELHDQVRRSVDAGARCLLGGEVPDRAGAYYPPTVLADVGPETLAYREELFGPVASVIAAQDEADAVCIANDSDFGLGAAVFTRDPMRGEAVARKLQAGSCCVNDFVKSDPRLPFGGIKNSGYGRELADLGIREFVNEKTVQISG